VRHTRWAKIDAELGQNDFDGDSSSVEEGVWEDEDAGWHRSPIEISVPFHNRAKNSGPKNFIVGELYHRSLVSVIHEKLVDPHDDQYFHYEPFQLFWNPTDSSDDIRVHGELYTSPAFLEAHRELQDSPREPGCDLPRVVVAMMFASDATHLTSFGNAKLWPCYLFFGNESKYHRCKPTYNLCNHVAYFQAVSCMILIIYLGLSQRFVVAPRCVQRLC
jgi:Plavaka transposase